MSELPLGSRCILPMIDEYKAMGYGWYWMLLEMMRERDQDEYCLPLTGKHDLASIAKELEVLVGVMNDLQFLKSGSGLKVA